MYLHSGVGCRRVNGVEHVADKCLRHMRLKFNLFLSVSSPFLRTERGCEPRDVSLHLKAGSYPVISPENITFPQHFLSADQR